ncbi:hypothetical protein KAU45_00735 [bacterium]|nr:hypothetical protein [bacterium]
MVKEIDNLRWKCFWTSHLGCIKGCLDYLGVEVSDTWLFGTTGHAFIINIHEQVCPSGPTAWNTEMITRLGKNVGYTEEVITGLKTDRDFEKKQELAWNTIKGAINEGVPCYGWELDIPEFYVIYGYDDRGYYYSGPKCDEGKGPKPWREVGNTQIGCLEMYTVKKSEPARVKTAVKEALEFVLEYAGSPKKWIYSRYKAGLAAYDNWIGALESATADGWGMAYNAAVWSECRDFAYKFLREAAERLGGQVVALFYKAAGHYRVVSENLKKVADKFPFFTMKPEYIEDETRRRSTIEALKSARKAEASGLDLLERLVKEL